MTPRASRVLIIGAIATALALTGCSGGDSGTGSDTGTSAKGTSTADSGSESAAGGDAADNGGKLAGIDLKNPPKAIATLTVPGEPKGDTTDTLVELVKFEKRGKILMAAYRVTPHGTKEKTSLFSAVGWRPHLLDPVNLKLYDAVADVSTGYLQDLVMNEPNYVMAGFAIPEGADTVDVGVAGRGGLRMEGVKLP